MRIRNFLLKTLEKITRHRRYRPEEYEIDKKIHWSNKIWISNVFRFYEYLFGRGFGIRAENSSSVEEIDGIVHVKLELYSFEAHIVYIEVLVRSYIHLLKTFLINSFTFQPLPKADYRPVYATLGFLGFVFSFHTSIKFLPLFGLAIALDTSSKGTATATSPLTWSATCTGSNLILIGGFVVSASAPTLAVPTYSGANFTLAGSQRNNGLVRIGLYYQLAPATGTNTVSSAFGGSLKSSHSGVVSWSGVAQTGQPDAVNGAATSTTNPSITVTTVADNSWVAGVIGGDKVPTANLTSRQDFLTGGTYNYKGNLQDTNGPKTPAGGQAVGWTAASITYALQAASFAPAASTTSIKTVSGLAKASVKTVNGLAIASVKTIDGLA